MRDFSLKKYMQLLKTLQNQGFSFQTLEQFSDCPKEKVVILRHDVDRSPKNALQIAKLENELGIKAIYYFRTIPKTFQPEIIKAISELGHEIGYHYENLSEISRKKRSEIRDKKSDEILFDLAIKDFIENLKRLREIVPIKNICMHGSPLSKYDNRDLWEKYDYRTEGIIGEPYLDIDWNKVFYITDAGRSWNNKKVSIRDHVKTNFDIEINSTHDLINKFKLGEMPTQTMLNIHPHNWACNYSEWLKIFTWQSSKNIIKRLITNKKK